MVFTPRERSTGENRVALTPDSTRRLIDAGLRVTIERKAGFNAGYEDEAYVEAGAEIITKATAGYAKANVVLKVRQPSLTEASQLAPHSLLISFLQPAGNQALIKLLQQQEITSLSLELLPRISRAQSMDALSSQASLGGYKAVLRAADRLGRYFPMLMSAAGTIAPAKVLVLGAGVAGLQAIATARRLGAVVEAYDVRPAVAEEVKSLGAKFLQLELDSQEGQGGYANVQSEEFLAKQRSLLEERVAASDVVITTAAIPGRPAPRLVTTEMVNRMRRGSVIVDLASESGGNCQPTRPDEVFETSGGVWIDGTTNLASLVPIHASQLYSRNVSALLFSVVKSEQIELDFSDEILSSCCVTHQGQIVSERAKQLLEVT